MVYIYFTLGIHLHFLKTRMNNQAPMYATNQNLMSSDQWHRIPEWELEVLDFLRYNLRKCALTICRAISREIASVFDIHVLHWQRWLITYMYVFPCLQFISVSLVAWLTWKYILSCVSGMACQVSGAVVAAVSAMTVELGRRLAPVIIEKGGKVCLTFASVL